MTSRKRSWLWKISSFDTFLSSNANDYLPSRAGCIPYTVVGNKALWLLGSFIDKPVLTDFGGDCGLYFSQDPFQRNKKVANYQLPFGCLLNEIGEETKGLLTRPILNSLGTHDPVVYRGTKSYSKIKTELWMLFIYIEPEILSSFVQDFEHTKSKENFGPVNLYPASAVLDNKYQLSENIQDFVDYLSKECHEDSDNCIVKQPNYIQHD